MCGVGLPEWCWGAVLVVRSGRAGRLGRAHRALRLPTLGWWLGAGLAAAAVNAVALIWELARMYFLTIRDILTVRDCGSA